VFRFLTAGPAPNCIDWQLPAAVVGDSFFCVGSEWW